MPTRLPTSGNVIEWRINVSQVLLQASAYSDRAEVAWFRECSEAGRTLESFQDSGCERLCGIDSKLAQAMSGSLDQHASYTALNNRHSRSLFSEQPVIDWKSDVFPFV